MCDKIKSIYPDIGECGIDVEDKSKLGNVYPHRVGIKFRQVDIDRDAHNR